MNTEEAIGMVCIGREQPLEPDEACEIVELLKRGEENKKYKKMWGDLKVEYTNEWDISHIPVSMEEIEQRYFPKPNRKARINKMIKNIRLLLNDISNVGKNWKVTDIIELFKELRDEES